MKKLIVVCIVSTSLLLLNGCTADVVTLDTVAYAPGYSNDYVYTVGYYNNRPYWGNNYYSYYSPGYNSWGSRGYWGGGYYNGY